MANILQFSPKSTQKFGFERVKRRYRKSDQNKAQLDLFVPIKVKIFQFPNQLSVFEEALLLDEQNHPKAAEYYWKAISKGENVADAYCNLGIIKSQTKQISKAFDCFTQSLKHDPRHFESHYNLANLYFELEDLKLAKIHYELADEIRKDFPNLYFNLALLYAILGKVVEAIQLFSKYKNLVPPEEAARADELLSNLQWLLEQKK